MTKSKFLSELAEKLKNLPQSEISKSIDFYSEIIDDRMEEGMSEEEAVNGLGNVEDIAREVMLDSTSLLKLIVPNSSLSKSDIALLVFASPLFIIMFALIFTFYAIVWLLIITLFLIELAFLLTGITGVVASIINFGDNIPFSLLMFFGGLICVGIGIFTFSPIKLISKKIIGLTIRVMRKIKSIFRKRYYHYEEDI
ncbi:DUF1700 domain-containing protein [Paenibacillus sp. Marseille-Q4541]|uniref:DUF1700 domain-containing protein n=1 Tax=Paenibacillus sp. Marseille-Q4541 TaxID=2831522 RepID=UPI001BAE0D2A